MAKLIAFHSDPQLKTDLLADRAALVQQQRDKLLELLASAPIPELVMA